MSKQLSDSLADAISSAASSIVRINGRPRIASSGIVWSDTTIVTASHAIHSDDDVEIAFEGGTEGTAKLVGRDPSTDVAVLSANGTRAAIAIGDVPRVGNIVLALGRPGEGVRAAFGIVSAVGRQWRTHGGGSIDRYIEVDGSLPAGFSGGPLIDAEGRLIGMNTSRLMRGGTTIPASTMKRTIEEILAHGSVRRPLLGVTAYPVEMGLLVMSVKSESAAAKAGLLVGDVIVAVGDRGIKSPRELREILDGMKIGSATKLGITRGGQAMDLPVTL